MCRSPESVEKASPVKRGESDVESKHSSDEGASPKVQVCRHNVHIHRQGGDDCYLGLGW